MSARVAVVVNEYGKGWSDHSLVVRRVCGALACEAEVDVLVARGPTPSTALDGAVRLIDFPAPRPTAGRALALRRALLGPQREDGAISCRCTDALQQQLASGLPRAAQEEWLLAAGGYSPPLFRELATASYDVVVFAGCNAASTYWGMDALGGRRPCAVLALAADDAVLALPAVGEVLRSADRILATTSFEVELVRRGGFGPDGHRLRTLGFVVRVNDMANRAPAYGFDTRPTLIVARDWGTTDPLEPLLGWCDALRGDFGPALAVRLVGPGAQRLPRRLRAEFAGARTDVWRWMAHSLALLDPEPHRLLGREVLESMLFATPVIVPADGGATRAHADAGNGGLWYRSYEELRGCVEALLDRDARTTLGEQGKAYVSETYGDTKRFIDGVTDAVLGLA